MPLSNDSPESFCAVAVVVQVSLAGPAERRWQLFGLLCAHVSQLVNAAETPKLTSSRAKSEGMLGELNKAGSGQSIGGFDLAAA